MSWLNRTTSSTGFQFGATAIAASVFTAGALLSYQALRRNEAIEDLKASIPELGRDHLGDKVCGSHIERMGLEKKS